MNLQEQGQLIRQDELYVMFRKKRALRRVFLFQDLILFTKTKKTHCGDDVYVYKQSFKVRFLINIEHKNVVHRHNTTLKNI